MLLVYHSLQQRALLAPYWVTLVLTLALTLALTLVLTLALTLALRAPRLPPAPFLRLWSLCFHGILTQSVLVITLQYENISASKN